MAIRTEKFVNNLPPREVTEGVDWLGILDGFDPSELEDIYLEECASRNIFSTEYGLEVPVNPIEKRLERAQWYVDVCRKNLQEVIDRIRKEGLSEKLYTMCRRKLITAIGAKGAAEYVQQEYDRLGEAGRARQKKIVEQWNEEATQYDDMFFRYPPATAYDYRKASVHEKVVRVRKGIRNREGRFLTQREFAKYLEVPIASYAQAERRDLWSDEPESEVEFSLLEKLILRAHANPYWLLDESCDAEYAEYDRECDAVIAGDQPWVYADADVILKWINEGKPNNTRWEDEQKT